VNTYATDDEQVEAIKKWWKENGLSVAAGLILGASLLLGWQAWQTYSQQKAETASARYEQVLLAIEKQQAAELQEAAGALLADYSTSPYATLAALALAKQAIDENRFDAAHAHFQWVLDNGKPAHVTHVARLRKAQLFLDQDNIAAAKETLKIPQKADFIAAYAELEGDIAVAEGSTEAAQIAYQTALSYAELNSAHRRLLQMKLDNLGQSTTEELVLAQAPMLPVPETTETTETVSIPEVQETPVTMEILQNTQTPEVQETPVTIEIPQNSETPISEMIPSIQVTPVVETGEVTTSPERAPIGVETTPASTEE
jgi:predicted negative regulator of RcsB-dependent stress response